MTARNNRLRLAIMALTSCALCVGCGDDDVGAANDAGYGIRDASFDAGCIPYFLANADRYLALDAGEEAGVPELACQLRPGAPDDECAAIDWEFAGGEHLTLVGCCTPAGACGAIDPTGTLGCLARELFGRAPSSCSPDTELDAGDEDANDDGSVPPT